MAASGPGEIAVIEERMTAEQYRAIMEEVMLPSVRAMLIPPPQPIYIVMDNSPVHNAHTVNKWFQEHPEVTRISWPARSPDLNPIENLWAEITKKWDHNMVRNKETLITHSTTIWESLRGKDLCQNLVASIPRRLENVIKNRGSYTKY